MAYAHPDSTWRYKAKSGYVLREIMGDYLLIPVSMDSGAMSQVATLNDGGKFLWEQLQQERTIAELVAAMTQVYEVSEEEAHADILEFVNKLQANLLCTEERK